MFVRLKGQQDEFSIPVKTKNIFRYMSDLKKYPALSNEEFLDLFYRYKSGDSSAFDKIISSNLRYVVQYAARYGNSKLDFGDVICAGNEAIIEALSKYDPSKGKTFISYSNYYISRKIRELYDSSFGVKLNTDTARLIHSKRDKDSDLSTSDIVNVFSINSNFKNSKGDDYDFDIEDIDRKSMPDNQFDYMNIDIAVSKLSPRERYIVKRYYGLNNKAEKNIPELARMYNTTSQNVSRILREALKKLKIQLEKIK